MKNNAFAIILRTACQKKLLSAVIIATMVLAICFALLPPMVLGFFVDKLTARQPVGIGFAFLYFILVALTGICESAREGALIVFGQKITHALRSQLMEKYLKLPAATLLKYEPGVITSRFVGDVDMVENLFSSGVISMFADACKIISILAVIWFSNRGLCICLICILPFIFLFTRGVQKKMLSAQIANRTAVSRVSGHVPETLHNICTIHNLSREDYMAEKYASYIDASYKAMEKNNFYDAIYSPVILVLNAVIVAVVMVLSASGNEALLSFFGMSAGTAVAVINYIGQIFAPVESLGMEIQTIQSAVAGLKRIDEFLSLEEEDAESRECITNSKSVAELSDKVITETKDMTFVEFKNVTFGYDNHRVLENFSMQVKSGQQVTLQGRTGAGKSTIFKLLLGLYRPESGQVLIEGRPANTIAAADRRRLYGYVEQSFNRVPGTVADQITLYDSSISHADVEWATKQVGLHGTIVSLSAGYDTICTDGIFSQGQWQLLSIARAVVTNPKLLLLDEITADLDEATEQQVLLALQKASKNRTLISISHRTSALTGMVVEI